MPGTRSTLFLLFVLVNLGAYIYFIDSKRDPSASPDPKDKAFSLDPASIEELEISTAAGESTTLRNSGGTWQIVSPIQAKADQPDVMGLTTSLATLDIQRVVEAEPADLSPYGLANPSVDIEFRVKGEKEPRRLLLGEKTSMGGDLYAKTGSEKKVFLISAFLVATFNKTTFDLRDKILVAFEPDEVDRIELSTPERTIRAVKEQGEWKLTAPLRARADPGFIEGLVGRLARAEMRSIAATDTGDLKKYGLDRPVSTVTIGTGSTQAALITGAAAHDGEVYARDLSRPLVVVIDSSLANELQKDVVEYRRKDVFEFRSFNANRLEIARDGATTAYASMKGSGEDAGQIWRQVAPAAQDVDTKRMDDLLSTLSNLQIQSFAAEGTKSGLDNPLVTVIASFDDSRKQERVTFGRAGADVFVGRPDEPGAGKLDAADFDTVITLIDELKTPPQRK